jgi:hypothetical protein
MQLLYSSFFHAPLSLYSIFENEKKQNTFSGRKQHRMKTITTLLTASLVLSAAGTCLGADARHGKLLFASPALGGGTSGKTCLTCHEHGRDFSPETLSRKQYLVMGNPVASLAGVVNFCIEVALRGEALPENGKEMNDLLAYLAIFIQANNGTPQ